MSENFRLEEAVEFAENPEPRCPCVLLLDTSGSMAGEALRALQSGLETFKFDLLLDDLAKKRVEVAVITFDAQIQIVRDFTTADQFIPPTLTAQGNTRMGAAIHEALDLVEARKRLYRSYGISYYRPWVFMITDGEPEGESEGVVQRAIQRIQTEEDQKRVAFFSVGVQGANMDRLRTLTVRAPLKLRGLNFKEMFLWLSASMQRVSQSKLDEQVSLPPPGWGQL
jgi:uncharacterized protein YegL